MIIAQPNCNNWHPWELAADILSIATINSWPFSKRTFPDAQPLFLKVSGPTEETFTAADQAGFFEMTYNAVVRHKLRVNGDDLILAETSCCFDFIGRKESAELYSVYSESLDKIPPSEVKSSISGKFLPSLIICSNGHVLRIRKKRKILSYPR